VQIYIHRNNQQLGPFTEAEIKAQLAAGVISPQDHVWWQGRANWVPLSQSPFVTGAAPILPAIPGAPAPHEKTSSLAIWSLACGCLTLFCGIFTAIPAVILGHMSLSEIKRHPNLTGRGLALTGLIIGYVMTVLIPVALFVLLVLSKQVQSTFKTLNVQMNTFQLQPSKDDSDTDQSTNSSDQSTNSADQSSPASTTNSTDSTTNSAPAITP